MGACSVLQGELAGPKARFHTSLGQRPRNPVVFSQSPVGASPFGAPLQGFVLFGLGTQGGALGWYGGAPLVLNRDLSESLCGKENERTRTDEKT